MAKALSKSQIAATLAEKVGVTKKQSVQYLAELAALAYKQARNSFTVPGLGKLVLVNR
jgi:DNA-binding protein HU-beta